MLIAVFFAIAPSGAVGQSHLPPATYADRQLDDPTQERAARALMDELRCLVCQGQSIADSDADLAGDMRAQVRLRIKAGQSPQAVRAWLIGRYGEWVSYDPAWSGATALLALLPLLALAAGGWLAFRRFGGGR